MKTHLPSNFLERTASTRHPKTWFLSLLLLLGAIPARSQDSDGNRGIFEAFITVNIKGTNDIIYKLNPGSSQGSIYSNFEGNIGPFFTNESLVIRGGDTKTYKNSGCDFVASGLYYYVHPIGTTNQVPLSSYTRLDQPFNRDLPVGPYSPGDQQWGDANNPTNTANIITGLAANRSYIIDVFVASEVQSCNSGNNGLIYYSNGGRNFQVTFSVFPAPLPVTLTRFEAKRQEADVRLSWETATEKDNRGYEVQVSTDSRTFRALDFVPSQSEGGNSSNPRSYSYLDTERDKKGVRYYRLRQVDLDGKETFYGPQVVSFSKAGLLAALVAAPNPFSDELTLTLPPLQEVRTGTIQLTDMLGRTVLDQPLTLAAGSSQARLPELNKLPKGLYHLRLSLNGELQSVKLLKE
jgi:hypothetical protein